MAEQPSPPAKAPEGRMEVMRPFVGLRHEIDRLFDDFMSLSPFRRRFMELEPFEQWAWGESGARHNADIVERDDAYEICVDVPGMEAKDINVSMAEGCLTVRGESKEEKEEKGRNYRLSERRYGSFTRSFRLPQGVDEEKITADLKNGVLMITVPKTPEAQKQQKTIEIKAGH